jgi:hypothetical protein
MRLRSITFVIIVALSAGSATAAPGAGIKRNHYPGLPAPAKTALWLVAKCKVADDATVTAGLDQNISDFFGDSGIGYGNLFDYFYDVSYHQYRFRTRIMDSWLTAPFNKAALLPDGKLFGSEKRRDRVEQCLQAIPVELAPDLDRFAGVAVITNFVKDGGACTPGTLTAGGKTRGLPCVWMDEKSLFTDFAAHEIGHGLGLGHSFDSLSSDCGAAPGEYCDPWDLMSAMRTF